MISWMIVTASSSMALPMVVDVTALKPSFDASFNEGGAAAVQVRVLLSPAGDAVRCEPTFLNGPRSNADAFCSMIQSKVKFTPATDASGRAAYGLIYLWSHWRDRRWKSNDVPSWNPVDLTLTVAELPKELRNWSRLRIGLEVDPTGTIKNCGVAAQIRQEIIDVFCREAAAEPAPPALNEQGTPVLSVQEFSVGVTSQRSLERLERRLRLR